MCVCGGGGGGGGGATYYVLKTLTVNTDQNEQMLLSN